MAFEPAASRHDRSHPAPPHPFETDSIGTGCGGRAQISFDQSVIPQRTEAETKLR
jgi:hypothetical protein